MAVFKLNEGMSYFPERGDIVRIKGKTLAKSFNDTPSDEYIGETGKITGVYSEVFAGDTVEVTFGDGTRADFRDYSIEPVTEITEDTKCKMNESTSKLSVYKKLTKLFDKRDINHELSRDGKLYVYASEDEIENILYNEEFPYDVWDKLKITPYDFYTKVELIEGAVRKMNESFFVGWTKFDSLDDFKDAWFKYNNYNYKAWVIYKDDEGDWRLTTTYDYKHPEDATYWQVDPKIISEIKEDPDLSEIIVDDLTEDTVKKSNGKWTNRGDDGTEHGEFDTKKEADAQRRAMFAQGYKGESVDFNDEIMDGEELNESSWAEDERPFTYVTQDKLEVIRDADLWDDMQDEIDDNPVTQPIVGVHVDVYTTLTSAYSSYTEDEIKAARKEMFRIINKYYKQAKSQDESLNESTDGTRKQQLVNNIEELVDEYLNGIYDGDHKEFKNDDELVDWVYDQLFDFKSNGSGFSRYARGICDDLKYLGKDYIVSEIIRIGHDEGVVDGEVVESLNEAIDDADDPLDLALLSFETGHYLSRDDFQLEEDFEEYSEYMEMGPSGFYNEYKDILDFSQEFIDEYGDEDDYGYYDDEDEEDIEESLTEDFDNEYGVDITPFTKFTRTDRDHYLGAYGIPQKDGTYLDSLIYHGDTAEVVIAHDDGQDEGNVLVSIVVDPVNFGYEYHEYPLLMLVSDQEFSSLEDALRVGKLATKYADMPLEDLIRKRDKLPGFYCFEFDDPTGKFESRKIKESFDPEYGVDLQGFRQFNRGDWYEYAGASDIVVSDSLGDDKYLDPLILDGDTADILVIGDENGEYLVVVCAIDPDGGLEVQKGYGILADAIKEGARVHKEIEGKDSQAIRDLSNQGYEIVLDDFNK